MAATRDLRAGFRRESARPSRIGSRIGAAALILSGALHLVLVRAVLIGERGSSSTVAVREGLGANAVGTPQEVITTLFFVEDASASPQERAPDDLASAGKLAQRLQLTVLGPDSTASSGFNPSGNANDAPASDLGNVEEQQARAALFGQYLAQVQARIERVWLRPRSEIGADSFDCQVRLTQGQRGDIREVALRDCNGSIRWQLSLVAAAERASPLPAPPDPKIFAESLQLSFSSSAYRPGISEEGFEPPGFLAHHRE
jgi:membrane protein involved in colicin uptake